MSDLLELLDGACELREATDEDHVDGVLPRVLARPRSTEETATLLRRCHEHDLAVVVRGNGSKLAWGRPPERLDVVLDTTGMDHLVEHARGDLIATAGAGMQLRTFQELLAEGGHQVVVDDLTAGLGRGGRGSTLGGAVATNLSGPRRVWAGATRDLVIGMRLVRADGTVAKAGGKVVKNVAGYDLSKLLTGSFGTLAVVTEVTVRLHPLPAASAWIGTSLPQDRLAEALSALVASQLVPAAIEVRARPGVDPAVVTMVSGTEEGTAARAKAVRELLVGLGCEAQVHDVAPPWWGVLLHPGQRGGTPVPEDSRPVLLKCTARLSGVADLVSAVGEHGGTLNGSAGSGVLYVSLAPDADAEAAVAALRATTARLGGSTVVLDAPPELKTRLDSWGEVPGLDLMRRVKDEFDPTRILAPGRFVGGL